MRIAYKTKNSLQRHLNSTLKINNKDKFKKKRRLPINLQ